MLGQFFIFGFEGNFPPDDFLPLVEKQNLGGVILFARNIESPKQISETIKEIKSRPEHPLFIMIDQEGGRINQITEDFPVFPSNKSYGDRKDKDGIFKAYKTTARELSGLGINVNLAPVVDVLTNPNNSVLEKRSFGEDPHLVAEMSKKAVEAIKSENILACGKHFPGIGDIDVDPHLDLPINTNSKERFKRIDFLPFKTSISSNVDMIMTTHVLCPNLDSKEPASLSKIICIDILRAELGFEGILITDDLQMGAIRKNQKLTEACQKAFLAGNDLILICDNFEEQVHVLEHFAKLVSDKKISEERLNFSLDKILSTKGKLKPLIEMEG
ncbi:MAG: beta-N-acetylhexosaminidase [candidate division Zixibacteria bacterium]|nr:beta-N-acetylhexosaminidase [candidate division Zixibacteria bacterium]